MQNRSKSHLWRLSAAVGAAVLLIGLLAVYASAGPIGTASGFEDDDGNLVVNSTFDWNGFSPMTWQGTAPYQHATKTTGGWDFTGLTDAQATTADTGFAGGIKQDVNCATLKNGKAPNKDDLKRIYISSKTVNGHVFLNLAWVRIPQNTVNASTHVGFEFNQSDTNCTGSTLVQRTAGDLLFVYDFEGSSAGAATLTVRKWVTSGACDISQDTAPCWGPATDLTASGFAEAKVNETSSTSDALAPGGTVSLGQSEFGEAGADLTAAGIFTPGVCAAFGQVEGVSRSSGNSGQAAMEDLVGPGQINLSNCGQVTIIKNTDPRGVDQNFSYTSNLAGSTLSCSPDTTPASFTLNDGASTTNTEDCTNVPIGSYKVTEDPEPNGFVLESLTCSATGSGSGSQDSTNLSQANITIAAGLDHVTCTYVNQQQLGAIKITKTSTKGNTPLEGATFSIKSGGTPITGSPFTTNSSGVICVDNLPFGDYSVKEESAPSGYKINDTSAHTVTVNNNATCSDATFVGEPISFTDTPLSQIRVTFHSKAGVGVTTATVQCTGEASASNLPDGLSGTGHTLDDLVPGTYSCTVVIDP